jgi:hypothetical protein
MLFFTRFQPFQREVKRVLNDIYFFSGIRICNYVFQIEL